MEDRTGTEPQEGALGWRERAAAWKERLRGAATDRRQRIAVIGLSVAVLGSCSAGALTAAWNRACPAECPTARDIAALDPQQASEIYDSEGNVLGLFYRERRQLIRLESLPKHVPLAFVAIEDRRYFDHEGVDVFRIVGAVRDNLFEGFGASGASTITMQLARNLFPQQLPAQEKSFRRKIAEAKLALEMEQNFSKPKILELYLNHIYLGAGAYGIEAAARTYFGKPAAELTIEEAAVLAGLPKAPSSLNPRRNPEGAEARRNLVLQAMRETGVISTAQQAAARAEPLTLAAPRGASEAPYFVEQVRRELEDKLGELLYTGGLRVHTTLNPKLQAVAEAALEEHLREIENGKYGHFPHKTYAHFTADRGDNRTPLASTPYLQGVVSVVDPYTGDVLALVGGRDFRQSQFNRATQALRQAGSAFKPFVYAAALEKGRSPGYGVSDAPLAVRMGDGSVWTPKNYSGEYEGGMTLRQALKKSKNMVAIRLGREVGIEAVRDVAKRTGIDTRIPGYPSVYIGSAGVYPLELITAYSPFANGGMKVEPHFIRRVEDRDGRLLWEPPRQPEVALAPGTSWILTDMLREVVDHGTGYNVRNPQVGNLPYAIPAAGKTGTTNESTDVWFVGYTPDLVAGVWLGMDQPKRIMAGATGGGLAVPVWARVVRTYYEGREAPAAWPRPADVVERRISRWTGRAVTADCIYGFNAYEDVFVASAAPAAGCEAPAEMTDPTPHLLGRPVFPGQTRVPRPEQIVRPGERGRP